MPQTILKVQDQSGKVWDFACAALIEVNGVPFSPETQSLSFQATEHQLSQLASLSTRVGLLEQDLLLLRTLIQVHPTSEN